MPEAIRDRVRDLRRVKASDLVANPSNWRTHPPAQIRALRSVIEQIGFAGAALAYEEADGSLVLIDGHARQDLAEDAEVPVLVLDVDAAEAKLLLATFDPLAAMAGTDGQSLAALLSEVSIDQEDLAAHLAGYVEDVPKAGLTDPDEVPEPPADPVTKPGDLWLLGDHRLLCGDSVLGAVKQVLGGVVVDLVWTDPPYGVAYQTKLSVEEAAARHRRKDGLEVSNDALTEEDTAALLRQALGAALAETKAGGCWWVAAPSGEMFDVFAGVLRELGIRRHTLVWLKDVFVMGRADYHYRHESLFYGWKPGAAHQEPPDRTQDSVWEIPRPRSSEAHPTMKPVELVARAIRNHSHHGEAVLDPFGGSGSTLVAAEQEHRTAYLVEIDPAYCDVIVARWEAFTGKEAVLDG